jgi:hypothetical protein
LFFRDRTIQREALRRYFRWVEIGGNGFRHLVESGMMVGRGILQAARKIWQGFDSASGKIQDAEAVIFQTVLRAETLGFVQDKARRLPKSC